MARSESFLKRQKEELNSAISEAYDNTSKGTKVNFKMPNSVTNEQQIRNELLEKYNKTYGSDFQKNLQDMINPGVQDKMLEHINGKEEQDKEIEQSSQVKDIEKQGIQVDESRLEGAKEKSQKDGTDLQEAVLKAIYEETLQKYYSLKLEMQQGYDGQIQTGEVSLPEKQSTELVLYENYLRKVDMEYKSRTGTFISKDDDDIKINEQSLSGASAKNERAVNKQADKNYDKIQSLRAELESISTDITYLSSMSGNMDADKFKSQMDELQKDYLTKATRLSMIEPNPAEYNKDRIEKEKEDEFRGNVVGEVYQKQKNSQVRGADPLESENERERAKTSNKALTDNVDISKENGQRASVLLKQFEKSMESGDIKRAEEILKSAEVISGIGILTTNVSSKEDNISGNSKADVEGKKLKTSMSRELEDRKEPEENITSKDTLKLRAKEVQKRIKGLENVPKEQEAYSKN